MGFIGGLLGTAGGVQGTGISGPTQAPIQTPTTSQQAGNAYDQNQQALANQAALMGALQKQNGLGNQSNVYNNLANIAAGKGPNPAQAMLNQQTQQNVNNQAALMAGQRGASSNPGLIARQAARQGANTQQQAVGQGATMKANQSLGALGQMGSLANQQVANQIGATQQNTAAQQAEQANLLNSINAQNNAQVGMQGGINSANASLAGIGMQGQQGMFSNMMPSAGSVMSMFGGAEGGQIKKTGFKRMADGGETSDSVQDTPPPTSNYGGAGVSSGSTPSAPGINIPTDTAMNQQKGGGGKGGGIGGLLALLAPGGVVQMAPGGMASPSAPQSVIGQATVASGETPSAPGISIPTVSAWNKQKDSSKTPKAPDRSNLNSTTGPDISGEDAGAMMAAHGGKVPAMLSPGERYLKPADVKKVAKGANPMKVGEKIPGKPVVGGAKNDYANDTVPKTLEEGGIVLPRSVTKSKHPHWAAHRFVSAIMAKNGGKIK